MAASASVAPGKLRFQPNVPEKIALKYPTGKICDSLYGDEKQVYFSLVDGRSMYVSLGVAQSITNLQLGNREPFMICKRWNGEKTQAARYDVWLTPEGEKLRAEQDARENTPPPIVAQDPPSELEMQLAASMEQIQARKRDAQLIQKRPPAPAQPLPESSPQSTGTHGPVAVPARRETANPAALQSWAKHLLATTNELVDVYAQACQHAESQGVPGAVVRTVMLSAFINISRRGEI